MKFYTDMEAVLGVWDGEKMVNIDIEIETEDAKLIALFRQAGLREEEAALEIKPKRGSKSGE